MIKILFFASNPASTTILALDEEFRAIKNRIRSAQFRDRLDLIPQLAAQPDDLLQELNQHKPQVVHFSGHGIRSGSLIMGGRDGSSQAVDADALSDLFRVLKDNIKVVVLNACYSALQANAIRKEIDCVVGMNAKIDDRAAIYFAGSFYRSIAFGRSIKDSFEQGIVALKLEQMHSESEKVELLTRDGVDAGQVILVPSATSGRAQLPFTEASAIPESNASIIKKVPFDEIEKDPLRHLSEEQKREEQKKLHHIRECLQSIRDHLIVQPAKRDTEDALIRVLEPLGDDPSDASQVFAQFLEKDLLKAIGQNRFEISRLGWTLLLKSPRE
jgi:hypothetical protein